MLLLIDCGNTNTVFSIRQDGRFLASWRIATDFRRTADEYFVWLLALMTHKGISPRIGSAIIASTVPRAVFNLGRLCTKHFDCTPLIVGDPACVLPVAPRVDAGVGVGPDLLATTTGAFDRHGGDLILVDFGTATTFDVVDHDGAYIGGAFAPGVNLSLDALYQAAAALPQVEFARPARIVGTNTVACMQSGVYWGYIGLVEGMIARIRAERGRPMKAIATGGLAPLFMQGTDAFDAVEEDLTLHGLALIFDHNRRLESA